MKETTGEKKAVPFNTIGSLIEMLKNDKNYKQAIKQGCNNYNISQYKINKIRLEEIPELVNLFELNYINLEKYTDHNHDKKKCSWLANQLKLFVWMAICHSYLSNKLLEQYDEEDWAYFTHIFTRKTSSDLEFQIKSVFKNFHGNKEKWDENEEQLLKLIIEDDQNKNKWNEVSRLLYFRSNKKYYRSPQKCRQYWFNHLDPALNKNPWTIDEELKLVKELQNFGFKWSKLTQIIETTWGYRRTEHMVKNRAKLLCRKYGFSDEKQQGCMKELARIERKLQEQKVKPRLLSIQLKQQESIDLNEDSLKKPQIQESEQKGALVTKKNQKQEKSKNKRQILSSSQDPQASVNLQSSSSEQDFQDVRQKNKPTSKTQESQNKRSVIILFHATNPTEEKKAILKSEESVLMDEQSESPEIMIGEHIEQEAQNEELREDNANEEVFEDEYNIVELVEDNPNMDLNQDMQFEHHTHGGTMRQRVTHQLAKFFPTTQNPTPTL